MDNKDKETTYQQKTQQKRTTSGLPADVAFEIIMKIVNKRRPFEPSDFVKETFIPDICLAAPLAIGAAMKLMPMVQYMLTQGKCL